MKLIQFISEHLIVFSCLAAVFFVIIIHRKNEGTTKRYDVEADTDRNGMIRRVKNSMERQSGGEADVKKRRKGGTVENDDFFADVTLKGRKK